MGSETRAKRESKPVNRFEGELGTTVDRYSMRNPSSSTKSVSMAPPKPATTKKVKTTKKSSKTSRVVTKTSEGINSLLIHKI